MSNCQSNHQLYLYSYSLDINGSGSNKYICRQHRGHFCEAQAPFIMVNSITRPVEQTHISV